KILAGSNFGDIYVLENSKLDTLGYRLSPEDTAYYLGSNRGLGIKKINTGGIILNMDGYLGKYNLATHHKKIWGPGSTKSADEADSSSLLVATGAKVVLLNTSDLSVRDKNIWPYRSTAVSYYNNAYYIGTVDGLFVVTKDRKIYSLRDKYPALHNRISYFI